MMDPHVEALQQPGNPEVDSGSVGGQAPPPNDNAAASPFGVLPSQQLLQPQQPEREIGMNGLEMLRGGSVSMPVPQAAGSVPAVEEATHQAARTVQVVVGDDEEVDEFGRRRKRKTAAKGQDKAKAAKDALERLYGRKRVREVEPGEAEPKASDGPAAAPSVDAPEAPGAAPRWVPPKKPPSITQAAMRPIVPSRPMGPSHPSVTAMNAGNMGWPPLGAGKGCIGPPFGAGSTSSMPAAFAPGARPAIRPPTAQTPLGGGGCPAGGAGAPRLPPGGDAAWWDDPSWWDGPGQWGPGPWGDWPGGDWSGDGSYPSGSGGSWNGGGKGAGGWGGKGGDKDFHSSGSLQGNGGGWCGGPGWSSGPAGGSSMGPWGKGGGGGGGGGQDAGWQWGGKGGY